MSERIEEKALRYNEGKPKWSFLDFKSLEPIVRVLEYGAHKYSVFSPKSLEHSHVKIKGADIPKPVNEDLYELISSGRDNWKKGLNREENLESMMRHLIALMNGEENDPESGLPHMGHIGCGMMFHEYMKRENKFK